MYLYYACTAHICLIYKGTDVYSFIYEIQYNHSVFLTWYQSHHSDFFFAVLSLIGVIPNSQLLPLLQLLLQPFAVKPLTHFSHHLWFQTYSCHRSESRNHYHIVTSVILASIVFLQVPTRSSFADLPPCGNLTTIGAHMHRHALPNDSAPKLMHSTRRKPSARTSTRFHAPTSFFTRLHTPDLHLLTSALGDVITATSPADIIIHIC